jgi:hypothetical protein
MTKKTKQMDPSGRLTDRDIKVGKQIGHGPRKPKPKPKPKRRRK